MHVIIGVGRSMLSSHKLLNDVITTLVVQDVSCTRFSFILSKVRQTIAFSWHHSFFSTWIWSSNFALAFARNSTFTHSISSRSSWLVLSIFLQEDLSAIMSSCFFCRKYFISCTFGLAFFRKTLLMPSRFFKYFYLIIFRQPQVFRRYKPTLRLFFVGISITSTFWNSFTQHKS